MRMFRQGWNGTRGSSMNFNKKEETVLTVQLQNRVQSDHDFITDFEGKISCPGR